MTLQQESQTDAELDALIKQQFEVQNQIDNDVQPDLIVTPDVPVVQQQEIEAQSDEELDQLINTSFEPVDTYVPPQDRVEKDPMIPQFNDEGEVVLVPRPTEPEQPVDAEALSRYEKAVAEADSTEAMLNEVAMSVDFSYEEEQAAIAAANEQAEMQEAMLSGKPGLDFALTEINLDEDVIVNNARRDKAIEKLIIPKMDDGPLKDFIAYGGADAFDAMISLGVSMQQAGSASVDAAQSFFEIWQDTNKASYDFFNEYIAAGAKQSPKDAAEKWGSEMINFFTMLEGIPVLGSVATLGRQYKDAATAAAKEAKNIANGKRFNLGLATANTAEQKKIKRGEAKKIADANQAIREQLIMNFEQAIGARSKDTYDAAGNPVVIDKDLLISVTDDGVIKLNNPAAKEAARKKLAEYGSSKRSDRALEAFGLKDSPEDDVPDFLINDDGELTIPIIKAENLDSFTAIAKDLLDRKPELYDPSKGLVDNLFELSVNKDIIPADELLDLLNKYDINFEEYATMMLGSASEAGRVLNKFSQISQRVKPTSAKRAAEEKAFFDSMNGLQKFVVRVENIRRGLLVSQLATAGRNLSSAAVRAPLEGLGNIMDTALYNFSNAKGPANSLAAGLKTFKPGEGNWTGSFRHMRYMFDPTKMRDSKQITDFVLSNDKYAPQFDMMFNTINEIRKSTGAGKAKTKLGRGVDGILNVAEAGVDILNTPNRWQEFLIRRGAFTGELERLVQREYGIDLVQALNNGRLPDLMNDASDLVPKGKRSFNDLVADATDKALDITYAKQPEVPVFRQITSFITRSGLTAVVPFPRFMFNSMELAGNYSAGAFAPVIKRSIAASTGDFATATAKLTKKDRQQISRNIIGATVILPAAMMYRSEKYNDDVPSDYKMLKTDNGLIDTTPQSPILRQALWVAEAIHRGMLAKAGGPEGDGTFRNWLDFDDMKQTFLGTNVRTGTGAIIFEDIAKMISTADSIGGEKGKEMLGQALAEYGATYLTPLTQVIEVQRIQGSRPSVFKDVRKEAMIGTDPKTGEEFEGPFMRGVKTVIDRRGFGDIFDPGSQEDLPARETVFQEEGKPRERIGTTLKLFTGIGLSQELSEAGQFMEELGYKDFKIPSRTISKGFNQYETRFLRRMLPSIVEVVKSPEFVSEARQRARQNKEPNVKAFVNKERIAYIDAALKTYKSQMDDYIADKDAGDLVTPDGSPIDGNLTMYLRLMQQYRRLSPSARDRAYQNLPILIRDGSLRNKEPNIGDPEHLAAMVEFAKTQPKP